ncbi:MAG TPA: DUF4911 domain-containing protein [Candidatus Avacidaminococcus intestinavium]|uniref:DUF4911 domain-containing protein n=1 Tax=Candidatus Avacidaminococcus intestinavium TaxID=2840684 RepID=A0A9D1MQS6_9FIRM|nr:DUF4911 domain-containing protein [Candidatus Avacidaminococcus intestinavium]
MQDKASDGIVYLHLSKEYIADLTRIMEGYEHIAMVTTIDSKNGIVKLIGTPDTSADLNIIIESLPFTTIRLANFEE